MASQYLGVRLAGAITYPGALQPYRLESSGVYRWVRPELVDVDADDLDPYEVVPAGIGARLFAARIPGGGSLVAIVTTSLGTDQRIPFSEQLVLTAPAEDPMTRIALSGTGPVEYVAAGG